MNNRIEQDHRWIKRRYGPMLGFTSSANAATLLRGIALIPRIRKGQMLPIKTRNPSLRDPFDSLSA